MSGQAGNLNYLVNLEADPRYNGFARTEYNYLPDLSLSEIVRENSYRDQTGLQASMTLGYDFTRDRVQFNALIGEEGHPYVIDRSIQRPPPLSPTCFVAKVKEPTTTTATGKSAATMSTVSLMEAVFSFFSW